MKIILLAALLFAGLATGADAAVNRLQFDRDINGEAIPFQVAPTHADRLTVTAGTPKNFTIPTDAVYVSFSREVDFYARPGATSGAMPTGDVSDGSAWEINPNGYWLVNNQGVKLTSIRVDVRTTGAIVATYYKAR